MAKKPQQKPHESEGQPGQARPGEPFDPTQLPNESESTAMQGAPRPSPGPHVPIPSAEYQLLKEQAKHKLLPPSPHAQQDRPRKK